MRALLRCIRLAILEHDRQKARARLADVLQRLKRLRAVRGRVREALIASRIQRLEREAAELRRMLA
jgi:hypothetical protein